MIERVRTALATNETIVGRFFRRTIHLTVRPEDSHFWSPHLDLQLEETATGTRLAAMFTPHPQVWQAFVAVQFIFALLAIFSAAWTFSVVSLGQDYRTALAVFALMMFGGGFAYGAAYVGQGFGSEQMYELRAFLTDAVDPAEAKAVTAQGREVKESSVDSSK